MPSLGALLRCYRLWPPPWWPWPPPKPTPPTRMAVAGYMGPKPDPNNPGQYLTDWNGQPVDWAWVLRQWDRIATAAVAVRLVVVDWSYTGLTGTPLNQITQKLSACRRAQQLVFGYVVGAGGAVPLGPTGTWWSVPRDPATGKLTGPVTPAPAGTGVQCVQD